MYKAKDEEGNLFTAANIRNILSQYKAGKKFLKRNIDLEVEEILNNSHITSEDDLIEEVERMFNLNDGDYDADDLKESYKRVKEAVNTADISPRNLLSTEKPIRPELEDGQEGQLGLYDEEQEETADILTYAADMARDHEPSMAANILIVIGKALQDSEDNMDSSESLGDIVVKAINEEAKDFWSGMYDEDTELIITDSTKGKLGIELGNLIKALMQS